MPINWKSPENTERYISCVFVWLEENKTIINHNRIAELFGNKATYDAVQGNFRKFKAKIEEVKSEAGCNGPAPVAPSRAKKAKKEEPAAGVLSGRVTKTTTAKKGRGGKVKEEVIEDAEDGEDGV